MIMRSVLVVLVAVLLSGCATATGPTAVNQLQIRMAKVESRLEKRDEDIEELQHAVEEIAASIGELAGVVTSPRKSSKVQIDALADEPEADSSQNQVLRVPITPQEAQKALKSSGYYDGAIDGKLGSGSQKAIKAFQKDHDLESDGIIGKKTWELLKGYLE